MALGVAVRRNDRTNSSTAGREAPTLIVNPGDNLITDFQNYMPAATHWGCATMNPCGGMMGTNVTNIHFHGTDVAALLFRSR